MHGGIAILALVLSATAAPPREGMVRIPAGSFTMGRAASPHQDESPAHRVELSAFDLDRTLVTVADFERFVAATHYQTTAEKLGFGMTAVEGMKDWEWKKVPGASWRAPWGTSMEAQIPLRPDYPVVMISWIDADRYCRHYDKRLPTEAEWEYAMRAGKSGVRFPWGDDPDRDGRPGLNYWQGGHQKNERRDGFVYLSPVGSFPPNAWGISDPVGNAWQWVADWYDPQSYAQSPLHDPRGPAKGKRRVSRGGSWWCSRTTCAGFTLYARGKNVPDAVYSNNGFRCAADP